MRFIVAGALGSMGRRRIRNLKALGYTGIIGYDLIDYKTAKPDCWYTDMLDEIENFLKNPCEDVPVDGVIVSVPPLKKQKYIDLANRYNVPVFAEADICLYDGTYQSSSTMRFHPGVAKTKELLNQMGKVYSFTFHHGSHLSDWRPNGFPPDYYAAKKESGACREMMAFEMSWLSYLFGNPTDICGFYGKKLNMENVTADDYFSTALKMEQCCGTFQCDMVTRPTIRELRISAEMGTLVWNWDDSFVSIHYPEKTVVTYGFTKGEAAPGYNPSICEKMYEDELANFIAAIQGTEQPMYTREEEEAIMKMLAKVEGTW